MPHVCLLHLWLSFRSVNRSSTWAERCGGPCPLYITACASLLRWPGPPHCPPQAVSAPPAAALCPGLGPRPQPQSAWGTHPLAGSHADCGSRPSAPAYLGPPAWTGCCALFPSPLMRPFCLLWPSWWWGYFPRRGNIALPSALAHRHTSHPTASPLPVPSVSHPTQSVRSLSCPPRWLMSSASVQQCSVRTDAFEDVFLMHLWGETSSTSSVPAFISSPAFIKYHMVSGCLLFFPPIYFY